MFTEEQRHKALVYVNNKLHSQALLDPQVGYEEEVDGIVHDAEERLFDEVNKDKFADVILSGQVDTVGQPVTFTVAEIETAANA